MDAKSSASHRSLGGACPELVEGLGMTFIFCGVGFPGIQKISVKNSNRGSD